MVAVGHSYLKIYSNSIKRSYCIFTPLVEHKTVRVFLEVDYMVGNVDIAGVAGMTGMAMISADSGA